MAIKKKTIQSELLNENMRLRTALWRLYILARNEISFDPEVIYIENLIDFLNDEEQLFSDPEITDDMIVELTTSPERAMELVIEALLDEISTILEGKEDDEEVSFKAWLKSVAEKLGYETIPFDGYPAVATVGEIKEAVREAREKLARKANEI